MGMNPPATESLVERMLERAERYPEEFSPWELERIEEWSDGRTLTRRQVELLTRLDVKTT